MIGNLINKIDKTFGIIFFNNLNPLSYCLFNFYYKKKILSIKSILDKGNVKEFNEHGFSKINNINLDTLNKINFELKLQNPKKEKNNRFQYKMNLNIINLIKKIIDTDFNFLLKDLSKYYNSNIYLGHALITRNYNYDPKEGESYSSYFHCDGYLNTYFKILVNLSDVSEEMGPIHVINKKDTRKNIGLLKYNSRNLKKEKTINSKIFKNISKLGDALLINTTECLHKAGIPREGKYRDMLYLVFCAYPNESQNIYNYEKLDRSIWEAYSNLVKKLAKPYGFINIFKLYKNFSNRIGQ